MKEKVRNGHCQGDFILLMIKRDEHAEYNRKEEMTWKESDIIMRYKKVVMNLELIAKSANNQFRLSSTESESKKNIENDLWHGWSFRLKNHFQKLMSKLVGYLIDVDEQVRCMNPWSPQLLLLIWNWNDLSSEQE